MDPVVERLDTKHCIRYRLSRGETKYLDGKHYRVFLFTLIHNIICNFMYGVMSVIEYIQQKVVEKQRNIIAMSMQGILILVIHGCLFFCMLVHKYGTPMFCPSSSNDKTEIILSNAYL